MCLNKDIYIYIYNCVCVCIYIYIYIIVLQCCVSFCCTNVSAIVLLSCFSRVQLYVYINLLLLRPPSHPPSHPSRSSQSIELSSLCYTAVSHQLSILHGNVYMSMLLSQFISPSSHPNPCPLLCSLCLHLYSCPGIRFINMPRSGIAILYNICFSLSDYFILCDRFQVHPYLYK